MGAALSGVGDFARSTAVAVRHNSATIVRCTWLQPVLWVEGMSVVDTKAVDCMAGTDGIEPVVLSIVGNVSTVAYHAAEELGRRLASSYSHVSCEATALLPSDYDEWRRNNTDLIGSWKKNCCVVLLPSRDLLGDASGLARWARSSLDWTGQAMDEPKLADKTQSERSSALLALRQPLVYLQVGRAGEVSPKEIIIELFHD